MKIVVVILIVIVLVDQERNNNEKKSSHLGSTKTRLEENSITRTQSFFLGIVYDLGQLDPTLTNPFAGSINMTLINQTLNSMFCLSNDLI